MQNKNTTKKTAAEPTRPVKAAKAAKPAQSGKAKKQTAAFEFSTPVMALLLAAFLVVSFLYEFVLPKGEAESASVPTEPVDWGIRIN